jgi:hypothetical protein
MDDPNTYTVAPMAIRWTAGDAMAGAHVLTMDMQVGWVADLALLAQLPPVPMPGLITLVGGAFGYAPFFESVDPITPATLHAVVRWTTGFNSKVSHWVLRPGLARALPWTSSEWHPAEMDPCQGLDCRPLMATRDLGVVVLAGPNDRLIVFDRDSRLRPLSVHRRPHARMGLSADGHFVVTAHRDRSVRVHEVASGDVVQVQPVSAPVRAIEVSHEVRITLVDGSHERLALPPNS